jgi:hypothetical protein
MKSSNIGKNDNRRLHVLADLRERGVYAVVLVVDKDRLYKDSGLRFQRPFRQFLNRKLYEELFDTFPDLQLVADEVGKSHFMRKFKDYLEQRYCLNTLFSKSAMEWEKARDNVFLQTADVICGSLSRCFDRKNLSPRAEELLRAMSSWVQVCEWPWPEPSTPSGNDGADDTIVRTTAMERAHRFIDKHRRSKDTNIRYQVTCLKYLLFHALHIDPDAYVHAPEIIGSIQMPRTMTLRQFQTRVIAKLRDAKVLIASDSRGYKLPMRMEDVLTYLRWTNAQVEPMVMRAKCMAEAIQLASHNKVRLLESEEFGILRGPSV